MPAPAAICGRAAGRSADKAGASGWPTLHRGNPGPNIVRDPPSVASGSRNPTDWRWLAAVHLPRNFDDLCPVGVASGHPVDRDCNPAALREIESETKCLLAVVHPLPDQ